MRSPRCTVGTCSRSWSGIGSVARPLRVVAHRWAARALAGSGDDRGRDCAGDAAGVGAEPCVGDGDATDTAGEREGHQALRGVVGGGVGAGVHEHAAPAPPRSARWALFAVYQAIHTLIGAAVDATGIPPEKISFPQALTAVTDTVTADFPPSGS